MMKQASKEELELGGQRANVGGHTELYIQRLHSTTKKSLTCYDSYFVLEESRSKHRHSCLKHNTEHTEE